MELTAWERMQLLSVIGSLRDLNVAGVYKALEVRRLLDFSEAERKAVGFQEVGNGAMVLDSAHAGDVAEVALSDAQLSFLKQAAQAFRGWRPVLETVALFEKLELTAGGSEV